MSIFKPYCFYPKETIERLASDILMQMQKTQNFAPKWPIDATTVADFLDLGVVWEVLYPHVCRSYSAGYPSGVLLKLFRGVSEGRA